MEARWSQIVEELKHSLQGAKESIMERERLFDRAEQELKEEIRVLRSAHADSETVRLTKELEIAHAAKKEGENKLRGVLKRNEQLLAELRELGDAVKDL